PDTHSASPGDRSETGSNHTDPCDETARPSPAPARTWPLHAPTDRPNWWPATTAPGVQVYGDGFCGSETRDFYGWQTCFQSETAADTSLRPPRDRTTTSPDRSACPDSAPRCRAAAPGHTV